MKNITFFPAEILLINLRNISFILICKTQLKLNNE